MGTSRTTGCASTRDCGHSRRMGRSASLKKKPHVTRSRRHLACGAKNTGWWSRPKGMNIRHRCAVCWERMASHAEWYAHASAPHGAVLAEFGYHRCAVEDGHGGSCPGVDHERSLRRAGQVPVRKRVDLGA